VSALERKYILEQLQRQQANTAPIQMYSPYLEMIKNIAVAPIQALINAIVNDMKQVAANVLNGDMAKAVEKLTPYLLTSFGLSLTFDLLQTTVLGTQINLRKTLDKLDRLLNPELALTMFLQNLNTVAVDIPSRYFLNATFTPLLPDVKTLSIGYFKGYFSFEELRKYYRMQGYADKFHDLILDLQDFTPSLPHIERIMRYYPVPKDVLEDWLRENGVKEDELQMWFDYLDYVMLRDEYTKYETIIRDLYVSGYISDAELDVYLQRLKANPQERAVIKEMWQLLKLKNLYKYYVDKQIYLFRKGTIDAETLLSRLQKFITDIDIAEAIVLVELARQGIDYTGRLEGGEG